VELDKEKTTSGDDDGDGSGRISYGVWRRLHHYVTQQSSCRRQWRSYGSTYMWKCIHQNYNTVIFKTSGLQENVYLHSCTIRHCTTLLVSYERRNVNVI